jgi:hypothetical protein
MFIAGTSAYFPVFPLSIKRSYKALQYQLYYLTFVAQNL